MHYYNHHIGDFIRDTSRLNDRQCMTYLRLIWLYYDQESPLEDNMQVLSLKSGGSEQDVELILSAYFTKKESAWHHSRCDAEIAAYYAKIEQARNAGKASAQQRLNARSTTVQPEFNDRSTDGSTPVQPTVNHKPITNNQTTTPNGFDEFWSAYPKKVGKGAAQAAWKKHKPDLATCIAAITTAKASRDWQKENGQYIPHPATWLNQMRWEDGETVAASPAEFDMQAFLRSKGL